MHMKHAAAVLAMLALVWGGAQAEDYGKVPDWSATVKGKKLSQSDYAGKVMIIDFWATWCPPCRKEIPGFIELQKEYADQGLVVLGFSFDKDEDVHDKWVKEQGLNYPSVFAREGDGLAAVRAFQEKIGEIRGIPTTLVVDRQGNIVYKHVGYAPKEEFERIIGPLLK